MGGQFLTNRGRIEQESLLFRIASKAPKGALLHLHFNAELTPETMLEQARLMDNMFIRSTQPILSSDDLEKTELVFNILPDYWKSQDIFSKTYNPAFNNKNAVEILPGPWMKWTTFREQWIARYGGENAPAILKTHHALAAKPKTTGALHDSSVQGVFDPDDAEKWLITKMVLSEDEAYGINQTVNG
jgi:adenosine deaminase CECR1